jgi:hypothetical protein
MQINVLGANEENIIKRKNVQPKKPVSRSFSSKQHNFDL